MAVFYPTVCVCVHVHAQSHPTLCDPTDCSPPGSSVHEILQARILEWVPIPSSRWSSRPRDQTHISCIAGGFFTHWPTWEALIQPCSYPNRIKVTTLFLVCHSFQSTLLSLTSLKLPSSPLSTILLPFYRLSSILQIKWKLLHEANQLIEEIN